MKHYFISAAIIQDKEKFLCFQRGPSKYDYISLKYEFPGGKIEEGESPEDALVREIKEELNLIITNLTYFQTVEHQYPDFKITMYGFKCTAENLVDIQLNEHLNYLQLSKSELLNLDWAAADIPFVNYIISSSNA